MQNMSHKKTWVEIERAVCNSRLQQFQLLSFIPSHFTFYKNLLIFLGVPPSNDSFTNENTLLYIDVDNGVWEHMDIHEGKGHENHDGLESNMYTSYGWNLLLDPSKSLNTNGASYSKEEELLRERKRLVSHGITSYEFDSQAGRILFRAGCDTYTVDVAPIASGLTKCATPQPISTNIFGSKLDAKIGPSNPNIISYIDNGDIWVANIVTGLEMRLTFIRNTGRDDAIAAGVPAYVTQEEFDRFTGYWWEPRKLHDIEGSLEVHKILYEVVDERMVEELPITSTPDHNFTTFVETYRYPRAGSPNAKSTLRLVEFCVKSSTNEFLDGSIVEYELRTDLTEMFPWVEYIVRCGWMPGGKHIWVQVLNRAQNRMALLRIPCSAFRPITASNVLMSDSFRQHKIDVLLEETSDYWINISDILHFLPCQHPERINFIWLSEQTNFKHLYQYTITTESGDGYFGSAHSSLSDEASLNECVVRKCSILEKKALTSGPWEVDGEKIWVDERNELVYFMALKDTSLEKHLYCISLNSPDIIHRLTKTGCSHNVSLSQEKGTSQDVDVKNQDCSHAVIVSSSISQLPTVNLCRILQHPSHPSFNNTGKQDIMSLCAMGWLEPPKPLPQNYVPPQIFSYTNSQGQQIFGMLFKPTNCIPRKKYPTILYVYAGPGVQLVSNSQRSVRRLNLYALPSLGYAVVMIDTMGSCNRGIHFESAIHNNMGCTEINQQLEGLNYIAEKSGIIDMNKIVIHGWSYGKMENVTFHRKRALSKDVDVKIQIICDAPQEKGAFQDVGVKFQTTLQILSRICSSGYLALMGLAQRPDVFKVAIAGAPVTCWELYDTGYTERYMNLPAVNKEAYRRGSVLRYAKDFPNEPNRLLIIHGLVDENVHFSHTNALISELIKEGKPYQLQVYPGERHGIRSSAAAKHYETYVLWFIQQCLSSVT